MAGSFLRIRVFVIFKINNINMDTNSQLNKLSVRMHKRTGYSIIHTVLEARDNGAKTYSNILSDFITFNSDEWGTFLLIINEACK